MPGETFSFNQVVGKRTVEDGYKDAKIYENGKVVDGLAGGICQISSTLYNAVLLANLEIVERTNHSYTSSYVPAGRDATVVYGVKDFQFKNTRSYPIKIEGTVSSGIVTFKIHGIKEETEYEVKIIPTTTSTIPYTTQTTVDYSLASGETVIDQEGHSGCKVTTYKQLWLNGKMVSQELLSNDTYNAMQKIIRVGPSTENTN
jgi:vancomycin resistance protein YoaR